MAILTAQLVRHQTDLGNLNGFLVGDLLELEAVESGETIERAFAATSSIQRWPATGERYGENSACRVLASRGPLPLAVDPGTIRLCGYVRRAAKTCERTKKTTRCKTSRKAKRRQQKKDRTESKATLSFVASRTVGSFVSQ